MNLCVGGESGKKKRKRIREKKGGEGVGGGVVSVEGAKE